MAITARTARQAVKELVDADRNRRAMVEDLKSTLNTLRAALRRTDPELVELRARLQGDVDAIGSLINGLEQSARTIGYAIGTVTELHDRAVAAENYE